MDLEKTMENTADYSKYKTFWPRFWAGWIDGLIFLPFFWLDPLKLLGHIPNLLTAILYLLTVILFHAYSVLMHGRFGQTLGKMVCKVKVIDKSEDRPITYIQAFMRDSVVIVMGLISCIFFTSPKIMQGTLVKPSAKYIKYAL